MSHTISFSKFHLVSHNFGQIYIITIYLVVVQYNLIDFENDNINEHTYLVNRKIMISNG